MLLRQTVNFNSLDILENKDIDLFRIIYMQFWTILPTKIYEYKQYLPLASMPVFSSS